MEAPKRIALDTSVIVNHLRGKEESERILELQRTSHLATTIINAFELYHGAYRSRRFEANLNATKAFLSSVDVLYLDDNSAERSAEVLAKLQSAGKGIDPRDLFTGCISLENGYALLTLNRRHFDAIPGLLVLGPSDLPRPK